MAGATRLVAALRDTLLWVVSACVMGGCGGAITAEALSVQPALLPLRAYPHVLLVPGPLEEDGQIARALTRHLKKSGHTRVQVIEERRLATHTQRGRIPRATVVVELLVGTHERVHAQYGHRERTTCDSLGCFDGAGGATQDVPVMRATLHVTVRDGRSMRVLQRVRLRALEASGSFEHLKRNAVLTLSRRLRASTEQIPEQIEVELLPLDLPQVEEAIDEALEGRWARARAVLEQALDDPAADTLSARQQARLHYDIGQAARATGLAGDPEPVVVALQAYARARALDPGEPRYAHAHRRSERDAEAAARVRMQRVQAARNFRFSAEK